MGLQLPEAVFYGFAPTGDARLMAKGQASGSQNGVIEMNANTTKVFFRVSQIIAGLAISFIVALGGLAAVEQISGAVSPAAAGTGWDSASGPDDGPGTGWDSTDDNPGTGWDSTDGPGTGWD